MNKLIPKYQYGTDKKKVKPISKRIGDWLHNQGYHEVAKGFNTFNNDMSHMFADIKSLGLPINLPEAGAAVMGTPIGTVGKQLSIAEQLAKKAKAASQRRWSFYWDKSLNIKNGQDLAKRLNFPILNGTNGKNYVKLPNGKLLSVEKLGEYQLNPEFEEHFGIPNLSGLNSKY